MHRYLQFFNIERNKFSGGKLLHPEIVSCDDILDVATDEARKHFVSDNVNCVYCPRTNKGTVFDGVSSVGEFSIVEVENATTNRPR